MDCDLFPTDTFETSKGYTTQLGSRVLGKIWLLHTSSPQN